MNNQYRTIARDGLWVNNPALVQLLGLCPLLAITNSTVNALGLGFATILTLVISNTLISLLRKSISPEIRLPAFVLIISSVVTAIELGMNAWLHELYLVLGIFIPLIVTNCAIIARAEGYASQNAVLPSAFDGLMMGLGFAIVLVLLGTLREAIGSGTLFAGVDMMFGEVAQNWTIVFNTDYTGFLVAILPPGAFLGLGLILAAKNLIDDSFKHRQTQQQQNTQNTAIK